MSDTPRVAVVAGARTPFAKAGAQLSKHRALDLGVHAVDGLLDKADIDPAIVETLVFGIVVVDARVPHLAREVNFQSRLPDSTRSLTITDNCITAASGIELVADSIRAGRAEVGIAGGVESMSNPSVLMSKRASSVFLQAAGARSLGDRLKIFSQLRPKDLVPQAPGVAEPSTGLSMGEHCELMVKEWKISREEQDEIAYRSHMNAAAATEDGRLGAEIVPLDGIDRDTMVRADTSMEKLAKLRPVFDPTPSGTLTCRQLEPAHRRSRRRHAHVGGARQGRRPRAAGVRARCRVRGNRSRRRPSDGAGGGGSSPAAPDRPRSRRHGHHRDARGIRWPGGQQSGGLGAGLAGAADRQGRSDQAESTRELSLGRVIRSRPPELGSSPRWPTRWPAATLATVW